VVAGIEDALESRKQGLRCAHRDQDFLVCRLDGVFGRQLFLERGAQLGQAGRGRIVGLVFDQRADGSVLDFLGRLEERLPAVECVDRKALGAQLHDLVANLHDVGESNFIQPLGQPNPAHFCRHGFVSSL